MGCHLPVPPSCRIWPAAVNGSGLPLLCELRDRIRAALLPILSDEVKVTDHVLGKQNVSGVATIHHPLGEVDASAGHIGLFVQVADFIHRPQ